jgi:DNA-binding MarR family transcriptional regulator
MLDSNTRKATKMLGTESRQVRRARNRGLIRKSMSKTERRSLFRRPRPEKREIINALLNMILSGELKVRS